MNIVGASARSEAMRHAVSAAWMAAFVACIVGANWAILHLGTDHGPGAPRTIAVGFGLVAPSGVLLAGAQFTLRDVLHERLGAGPTLAIIAASAPASALLASPTVAAASIMTFLAAETTDLIIYRRLRRRGYTTAVLGSNLISTMMDSMVFLTLAFGATLAAAGGLGMTVGKLQASILTLLVLATAARIARSFQRAEPLTAAT